MRSNALAEVACKFRNPAPSDCFSRTTDLAEYPEEMPDEKQDRADAE